MKTGFRRRSESNVQVYVDIGDPYPGRTEFLEYWEFANPALQTPAIKTWGGNNLGQLGLGNTSNASSPVQIGGLLNWQQASAGALHSAAIRYDGTLWTWGNNNYGQLGDNTFTSRSSPVQVGNRTDWQQVSCGFTHTLAISKDGNLWAWGSNIYNQLGIVNTVNIGQDILTSGSTYTVPSNRANAYNVQVYGSGGTGGTMPAGTVSGAGGGGGGGGYAYADQTSLPLIVPGSAVSYSAGYDNWFYSSSALYASPGNAGSNGGSTPGAGGAGGTGSGSNVLIARNGGAGATGEGVTPNGALGGGGGGGAAGTTANGSAGVTSSGQGGSGGGGSAGDGGIGGGQPNSALGRPGNVGNIYGGGGGGGGIEGNWNQGPFNGTPYAGGTGANGAIIITYERLPFYSSPIQVGNSNTWIQVSAGGYHSLGIKTDYTAWSWGNNSDNQCGVSGILVSTPTQLLAFDFTTLYTRMVSAGQQHSMAISTSGNLFTWGDNTYGQLGNNSLVSVSRPTESVTLGGWKTISAHGVSSGGILDTHALYTWGYNGNYNLGLSDLANKSSPVKVGLSNWQEISMGLYHSAGIKYDGSLWMWGYNVNGEIGNNTSGSTVPISTPSQISNLTNWKQVSANGNPINILWPTNGNVNIAPQGFTVAIAAGTDF